MRRQYDVLRAICTYAVNSDFIARTPCRNMKLPKVTTTRPRALTKAQLVELADTLGERYGPMVYAGAVLGLQWGEYAGLRVADLDFLVKTVTINTQRTRGVGGRMVERMPKSEAGRRTLSVPPALMELFAAHLKRRGVTAADPDAYVFVGTQGRPPAVHRLPPASLEARMPEHRTPRPRVPRPAPDERHADGPQRG